MLKRILSYWLIFLILAPPAFAVGRDVGRDPVIPTTDKQFNDYLDGLPQTGDYEVCVYSDTEGIGHGFIKVKPPNDDWRGYGFAPLDNNPFCGNGIILDDTDHVWNHKICYNVTRDAYIKILKKTRDWRTMDYYLLSKNCVAFVQEAAKAAGITIPGGGVVRDVVPNPSNFDSNIKKDKASIENTNKDKSKEMVKDSSGNWVPEEPKEEEKPKPEVKTAQNNLQCNPAGVMETLNQQVASIPPEVRSLVENQRVQITFDHDPTHHRYVDPAERGPETIGLLFQGTRIAQMEPTVENPTVRVFTNERTLEDILTARDPTETYRVALARGDIRIQHSSPAQNLLLKGVGFFNKLGLLLQPPRYLISVGGHKDILIENKPYTLSRPGHTILLQGQDQPYATVINSNGVTRGYTTPGAARVITLSKRPHTQNSGVYSRPMPTIRQMASTGFTIPPGYARQATQARQYTMPGGANSKALLLGGAGLSYGFRGGFR